MLSVEVLRRKGRLSFVDGFEGARNDERFGVVGCVDGWFGLVLLVGHRSLIFLLFFIFRYANELHLCFQSA